ncbi:MAG TPA: hypothetical protein VL484_15965 [Vicinamibacterales bacterium]|jgi:hypothetical protein|nr:hypothetical protein [Vicinamibacterales bacterium]
MKTRNLMLTVIFLAAPAFAGAQDTAASPATIGFPGSVNVTFGTVAPTEPGNLVSLTMLEQGVTVWRHRKSFVSGVALASAGRDSQDYVWNNRHALTLGVRFSQVMSNSVLQINAGQSIVADSATAPVIKPVLYASYWAGWHHPLSGGRFSPSALPGSVSATTGISSALEPDNWVSTLSVDQGVSVYQHGHTTLIPYSRFAISADTRGFAWDNRTSLDGGLKVRQAVAGGVIDLGVAARRQQDRISGSARTAPVAFVELWYGWNPRAIVR